MALRPIRTVNSSIKGKGSLNGIFVTKPSEKSFDYGEAGEIQEELNSNHIYIRPEIRENKFNKFSRFGYFDLYEHNSNTREYVFFTKPDLHLFKPRSVTLNKQIADIPFFKNCAKNYTNTMCQLQQSASSSYTHNNPFCNLLTNSAVSRIDLSDVTIDKLDTAANVYGNKLEYPLPTTTSSNLQEFNIEFQDNKFLDVYMFFKIWYEYELLKIKGLVTPTPKGDDPNYYIINKILHDQMSVYKITVGEDMETIIHWAKYWGVYPNTIPRSTFSDMLEGPIKFSVSFSSQWVEDMDPLILHDFNEVVTSKRRQFTSSDDIPIYKNDMVNGQWCNIPYIVVQESKLNNREVFKLKWR